MGIQEFAVPPMNTPIMEFSKTAPNLSKSRDGLRKTLRETQLAKHKEIQDLATAKPSVIRRRTQRQMSTHTFNTNRFEDGKIKYKRHIADRLKFIQDLEDKDRQRFVEAEIERGREAYEAAEDYIFEYKKATHLTAPRETIELNEIGREERLYKEAAGVIRTSNEFSEDYSEQHVGDVRLPPKTPFQMESALNSAAYIAKTQEKEDAYQSVNNARASAAKLYADADSAEDKVRTLAVNLERTGDSMSFEARIASRKKMLALKDEADFLREQATVATSKADKLAEDMMGIVYADTVPPLNFEELEGKVDPRIKSWVLCRPVNTGGLGKVFYGSFSGGDRPPLTGWVSVDDAGEEKPNLSLKGPPERALKQRMDALKKNEAARQAALENGGPFTAAETPPASSASSNKTVLSWIISGAAIPEVNGRYIECGVANGTFKFQNEEGVTLTKTILKESPDLNITAATCNVGGTAGHDADLARKLTRIISLPDSEIEGSDLDKNPNNWGRDFNSISRAGLSMITLGLKEKLRRKQEQKAEAERQGERRLLRKLA